MAPELTSAIFLDRDGTIIEDRGHLRMPSEALFFPDTVPALARLQAHFRLFVVTHQPGIAQGLVTAGEVARVNAFVVEELRRQGVTLTAVYCCPHRREEGCGCIKPHPFFLHQAAEQYGLDLTASFVVGDHPHDVVLADNAGAQGIYVRTGHGAKHLAEVRGRTAIVPGIREAADWILARRHMQRQETRHPGGVAEAASLLRNGGLVAFPTETVYGLGAAAFNPKAVARVFEVKGRPHFDPLIVHVAHPEQVSLLATAIPPAAQKLIDGFWPGPLTLVLPKSAAVPDLVTAGLPTVAIRMPRHPLALALIEHAGTPIAAPSANPFGYVSPTTARHVLQYLGEQVDRVLDGGPCAVGLESTILSWVGPRPVLLRAGGIPREEIEQVLGTGVDIATPSVRPEAPGQLPRHYSPRTRFVLGPPEGGLPPGARIGRLCFRPPDSTNGWTAVEVLSRDGDLREAAIHFFEALHRLDDLKLDLIVADAVPETGLGVALMDRLRRAAAPAGEISAPETPNPLGKAAPHA